MRELPLTFFRYEVLPSAPPSHVRPNLRHATASSSTSNQDHLTSSKAGSTDLPSLKHASTKSPHTRQTTGSLKTNHNPDYSEFSRDSISTRKNMSWFSILPASISFIETWVIRIFILLGLVAIGPWLLLIVYDFFLYLFRTATYEIPYIGGRARNRPRPRAPSLSERPSGKPRSFSLTVPGVPTAIEVAEETAEGLKKRVDRPGHGRGGSKVIDNE